MISRYLGGGVLVGALTLGSSVALAQGDAEAGEKVFNKCKACHVADEPQTGSGRTGRPVRPSGGQRRRLQVLGRHEGSGVTWSEETISKYIADPRGYIKGNRMAFVGLKDEEDVANLVATLRKPPPISLAAAGRLLASSS